MYAETLQMTLEQRNVLSSSSSFPSDPCSSSAFFFLLHSFSPTLNERVMCLLDRTQSLQPYLANIFALRQPWCAHASLSVAQVLSPKMFPNTAFCCGENGTELGHIVVSCGVGFVGGLITLFVMKLGLFAIGVRLVMRAVGHPLLSLRSMAF